MSKHTPGPLAVWGTQTKTEIGGFTVIGRADHQGGCTAYVSNAADATLYAAAPTMLLALKDVYDFLKRSGYDTQLIRETIAEAEGRSP